MSLVVSAALPGPFTQPQPRGLHCPLAPISPAGGAGERPRHPSAPRWRVLGTHTEVHASTPLLGHTGSAAGALPRHASPLQPAKNHPRPGLLFDHLCQLSWWNWLIHCSVSGPVSTPATKTETCFPTEQAPPVLASCPSTTVAGPCVHESQRTWVAKLRMSGA